MAIAEKEIHKSLVQKFVRIIEEDKKRKVPVIKYIRPGFLLALTQRFKGNKNKINFIGITGESASGKSTFVRTITKKITTKRKRKIVFINFCKIIYYLRLKTVKLWNIHYVNSNFIP